MLRLQIAIHLGSLRQPFKQALATARRLGADAVEIDARGEINAQTLSQTGRRQIRKLLDDHELRAAALVFRTRRGYDVLDELDRRVEATKAAMQLAYVLGAAVVTNYVGPVPADDTSPSWRVMVESLTDLALEGQRAGAILCAETGTETGNDLRRLLAALPQGLIGVTLDPGNLIVNGFAPLEVVENVGDAIRHVHVNDGVRDPVQARGHEVVIGRGSADFPALLGALEERQYRGYLSIERRQAENPVFEISEAMQFLRNL